MYRPGARVAMLPLALFVACSSKSLTTNSSVDGGADARADGTVVTGCATDQECASKLGTTTPPDCATATCNLLRGACEFVAKDEDGDGHAAADCKASNGVAVVDGDDCDDQNKDLYPGRPAPCSTAEDGGVAPQSFCVSQVSCNSDGTKSGCIPVVSCSNGQVCEKGACVPGCDIAGVIYTPGQANPADPCQTCESAQSTVGWTNAVDGTACGNGQSCANGACGTQCEILGKVYPSGSANPANPCQSCQPGTSVTAWENVTDGTICGTGMVCSNGACLEGCYIGSTYYAMGAPNPANPSDTCHACEPATSTTTFGPTSDGTACSSASTSGVCCTGTCTLAQVDPSNCGGCGVVCEGGANGACAAGLCYLILASGQDHPWPVAVDSTSVYWTNYDSSAGSVVKMPLAGGSPVTLASARANPLGLAIDATSVYWTEFGTPGSVLKVPLAGGALVTLASNQANPTGIAVDGASVYWSNWTGTGTNGSILKMPLTGGTLTTLASGQAQPIAIAVDGSSAYWTNSGDGTVMKVALTGGTPTTLATSPANSEVSMGIAVSANSVYWADGGNGTIMKVASAGGIPTTLASGQGNVTSLVVDATTVYWLGEGVLKAPLGGGAATTLAGAGGGGFFAIAVDGTSVYWSDSGMPGNVLKVHK